MRFATPLKNRRLRAELTALVRAGGDLNRWRESHPNAVVRLERAKLPETDLRGANLRDALLNRADISRADLSGADLTGAVLRGASLRNANLEGAQGLAAIQLAGCDLTGVKLPASVDVTVLEKSAELGEAAGYTRHLFMWMAGMCGFCLLTLATMPCCQLLTTDGEVELPVFSASVRTSLFFIAAPLLLIATFHYFHICLQRLWERLADLPAIFPDGQPLDRKTNGWIMLSLAVRSPRRTGNRRAMFRTQTALNILLAYIMVPATVLAIWWRYALRHDWNGSILHALAVAWTICLAVGCYAAATGALRGKKRGLLLWGRYALAAGALFFMQEMMHDSFDGGGMKFFNVHLKSQDVSQRPNGWTTNRLDVLRRYKSTLPDRSKQVSAGSGAPSPAVSLAKYAAEYEQVYAQVRGAQLTGVNLAGAVIIDSNLAAAEMLGANLHGAELMETDLSRAQLGWADLSHARLLSTWLVGASLQQADLRFSELYDIVAFDAQLGGADMAGVKTVLADFRRADLTKATLNGAELKCAQLAEAKLDNADLRDATLVGADLRGASLQNADLTGAKFGGPAGSETAHDQRADLRGADLTGCRGLTHEQLALAVIDANTRLPDYLVEKPAPPVEAPIAAATAAAASTPQVSEAAPGPETGVADAAADGPAEVAESVNPLRSRR